MLLAFGRGLKVAKRFRYSPVQVLGVFLWGRRVGALAPTGTGYYAFEYDPEFLSSGIEISPILMPLGKGVGPYVFSNLNKSEFMGLPPVFADSLPDAFGNGLINEFMRANGIPWEQITPLDRLAYVGSRAMGALTYEPERGPRASKPFAMDMRKLVEQARMAMNGQLSKMSEPDALRMILRVGTSAGGGKAKAIVGWNRWTGQFVAGDRDLPEGFEPWLIKFTPPEYPYRGPCEYAVYEKARAAGVEMSECRLLELDGLKHFMTRRFDREGSARFHVQTLSAMRGLPLDAAGSRYSYDQLFMTAEDLSMDYEAKEQLFRRMAFAVYVDESDDHAKNTSFLLREGGRWTLSPAYDITGGAPPEAEEVGDSWCGWHNFHAMLINGKQADITNEDLLAVADRFGIGTAKRVLREVRESISNGVG